MIALRLSHEPISKPITVIWHTVPWLTWPGSYPHTPVTWGVRSSPPKPYAICSKEREDAMTGRNGTEGKQQTSHKSASCVPDPRSSAKCMKSIRHGPSFTTPPHHAKGS